MSTKQITEHYGISYHPAKSLRGRLRDAGWSVYHIGTGRTIGLDRQHATEDAAAESARAAETAHAARLASEVAAPAENTATNAPAQRAATSPAMVTPRQLAYIRTLIDRRTDDDRHDGFMSIPSDLATLTRGNASALIASLKGEY